MSVTYLRIDFKDAAVRATLHTSDGDTYVLPNPMDVPGDYLHACHHLTRRNPDMTPAHIHEVVMARLVQDAIAYHQENLLPSPDDDGWQR